MFHAGQYLTVSQYDCMSNVLNRCQLHVPVIYGQQHVVQQPQRGLKFWFDTYDRMGTRCKDYSKCNCDRNRSMDVSLLQCNGVSSCCKVSFGMQCLQFFLESYCRSSHNVVFSFRLDKYSFLMSLVSIFKRNAHIVHVNGYI